MRTERFYMASDLFVCQADKEYIMLDGFIFIVFYKDNRNSHILLFLTCQRLLHLQITWEKDFTFFLFLHVWKVLDLSLC